MLIDANDNNKIISVGVLQSLYKFQEIQMRLKEEKIYINYLVKFKNDEASTQNFN